VVNPLNDISETSLVPNPTSKFFWTAVKTTINGNDE